MWNVWKRSADEDDDLAARAPRGRATMERRAGSQRMLTLRKEKKAELGVQLDRTEGQQPQHAHRIGRWLVGNVAG